MLDILLYAKYTFLYIKLLFNFYHKYKIDDLFIINCIDGFMTIFINSFNNSICEFIISKFPTIYLHAFFGNSQQCWNLFCRLFLISCVANKLIMSLHIIISQYYINNFIDFFKSLKCNKNVKNSLSCLLYVIRVFPWTRCFWILQLIIIQNSLKYCPNFKNNC